jgi:tetratricopeptide (TPR) repeat protein/predicted Ser/Thr protein kinase
MRALRVALRYPAWVPTHEGDATQAGTSGDEPRTRAWTHAVEPGAVVGRHVVLHELGAGGMGVVYAAYDPELDRKVALKLLLPGSGGDTGRLRLLREAQALARLAHPNVVGIHDVGTVGEQVWLAMEFVEGQTLGQWLAQPRGWPQVLEILRKAGEGLAAAHAVDLLHRDFKPDNVMVGEDGRVRVMDFGLARLHGGAGSLDTERSQPSPEPSHGLASHVTRMGALVGTPGYMAPEQFDAKKELTAAADQFAFCVTLWEALYGERPFGGDTPVEHAAHVLDGKLRSPTRARAVPGWLRRVCERGLAVEPAQRWPSMNALLDTLAKGRTRAAVRKGLAAVGVLALLGAGVEAQRRWDLAERTAACETAGDEVEVAWNAEREQALRDALVATGVSYAATTADKVTPWLDRRAVAWREARVETCLDFDVRGRWDAERLDRSLWCLEERRMELQSLVDELTLADAGVLHNAVSAAAGLAPITACRDENVLATQTPPAQTDHEALRSVRADVIRAANLERAGRYGKGLPLAREALERAEGLRWPPLVAMARLQLGSLLEKSGASKAAEIELERAYFDAAKGVAPEVVVGAATELVYVVGVSAARHVEGRRWARLADVALSDVPDGEHLRRASLLVYLANVDYATGAYDEAKVLQAQALTIREEALGPEHLLVASSLINLALAHHATGDYEEAKVLDERALAILTEAVGPEHPEVAISLSNLALVHQAAGDYEEAKVLHERAIALTQRTLGPEHLDLATSFNNLAIAHYATGDYEEAKVLSTRALALWEAALGPEHPHVASVLTNLAGVHYSTGDYDEAKVLYTRALALCEAALGSEHPDVANNLNNLAAVQEAIGDYDGAKVLYERALAVREAALGAEHPEVARSISNLAGIHRAIGDHDEAKVLYERALAIWQEAQGPEHPDLAYPLVGLALVALAQDHPSEAIPLAERAVTLREHGGVAAELLAEARFTLARALEGSPAAAGRDRARARVLAEQARDAFRAVGKGGEPALAEAEAWLAAHPLE